SAGHHTAYYVARWDGSDWEPVGAGFSRIVTGLEVVDDGSGPALYAFHPSSSDGVVSRWNGLTWHTVVANVIGNPHALAAFDAGAGLTLCMGGDLISSGSEPLKNFAVRTGSSWVPPVSAPAGPVEALAVFDDGTGPALYLGGRTMIGKWDGKTWTSLAA